MAPPSKSLLDWLPGLQTLRSYEIGWLRNDIVAGIVLSTMLVPVGIAYATASGVPAIYGLYATIVPLLVYALFGPSRILVLGPDSSLAPIILGVVLATAGSNPDQAILIASGMAVVAGLTCILAGLFGLGFITELLSKPIRYGYMSSTSVVDSTTTVNGVSYRMCLASVSEASAGSPFITKL